MRSSPSTAASCADDVSCIVFTATGAPRHTAFCTAPIPPPPSLSPICSSASVISCHGGAPVATSGAAYAESRASSVGGAAGCAASKPELEPPTGGGGADTVSLLSERHEVGALPLRRPC